jgi:hypothetical protein
MVASGYDEPSSPGGTGDTGCRHGQMLMLVWGETSGHGNADRPHSKLAAAD